MPRKARRSAPVIGWRRTRWATSATLACGKRLSIQTETSSSGRKHRPVTAGIQPSLTARSRIGRRPTLFTTPLETMNEQLMADRRISVVRRPSRYQTTSPQIIPSGTPLKKMARTFHGSGTRDKRHQGGFRRQDQPQDGRRPPRPAGLGADLDPQEFRRCA